jgi:hypothetical protein
MVIGGWVGMNDDDLFIEKKMGGQGGGVSLWLENLTCLPRYAI